MASTDLAKLANFQTHFEDMRALIHCKICLKPFYEPFTLPCGHTYCYSCLSSWCTGSHNLGKSKTCPDCRATITSQPCPNFLLRDLVQMFLTHIELLPEDETLEEHRIGKEAEARLVAADRAGRGLFKGLFHKNRFPLRGLGGALHAAAIVDAEDGVVRCPVCAWELEDGECGQCGWNEDEDDGDFNSDEDDRDISPVDDFGGPLNLGGPQNQHLVWGDELGAVSEAYDEGPTSPAPYSFEEESSEDDLENEDDDDDMSSFISNDQSLDHPDEAGGDDESVRTVQGYDQDSPAREYRTHSGRRVRTPSQPLSPRYSIRQSPPRFHAIDVSDTSDDSSDSRDNDTTVTTTTETSDDNSEAADDSTEQQTDYDSGSSSVRDVSPPIASQPLRLNGVKRRRIIEDDSDEDEESDDTAIRPTHANDTRARHLNGQRQGGARDHPILRAQTHKCLAR